LIAIGQWEESEGGELRFVDWDLRQCTREQEEARRKRNADKQRAYREREKKRESSDVTGNVPGNVTAPSSSSSSSPFPDPDSQEKTETPRSRSGVRVGGDDPVFAHWVQTMGRDPARTKPT